MNRYNTAGGPSKDKRRKRSASLDKHILFKAAKLHSDERGALVAEYAMITAIITVGIFMILFPHKDAKAKGFYNTLRDGYRRMVVFVSVPLL